MRLMTAVIKIGLIACMLFGGRVVLAGPQRCSAGNQDSTCVGQIATAWQTAPTCPAAAGWTTVVPATWIGSQYSAPKCNYQAPPSCPTGYTQTAGPTWNGSSWGSPGCVLPQIGGIPSGTPESQVCLGAMATVDPWGTPDNGYMHWSSDLAAGQSLFGTLTSPVSGTVQDTYDTVWATIPWGNIVQVDLQNGGAPWYSVGNYDLWSAWDGYGGLGFCWVQPGTNNVIGLYYVHFQWQANGA
jgi:hypothetical protein